jgi:aryl-alcohol dehydrogenase-like predicted oxidoreductase
MEFEPRLLGRTGLKVGRLGVAASYGVPAYAVECAAEQGANYLYWGSIRTPGFAEAIRNLASKRDQLVVVVQSYARIGALTGWGVERALRTLRLDYADILLLGLWNKPIPRRILDAGRALQERGRVRFLAVSSHNRRFVSELAGGNDVDVVHFR